MMEAETVSETLEIQLILTWLILQEDTTSYLSLTCNTKAKYLWTKRKITTKTWHTRHKAGR